MAISGFDGSAFAEGFLGGGLAALIIGFLVIAVIIVAAFYIYFALAWMKIAKKKGYKNPWLAWIPFANIAMWLQLGGFHWAWIFLMLIPILGWAAIAVLFIIANWRVLEYLKYPGWLSLVLVLCIIPSVNIVGCIGYAILIGFMAWNNPKKKR